MWSNTDIAMMSRAIMLARRGRYTTRPNPNVGCVIIDADGKIVGEGWHRRAGEPHAEVHALKMAADKPAALPPMSPSNPAVTMVARRPVLKP